MIEGCCYVNLKTTKPLPPSRKVIKMNSSMETDANFTSPPCDQPPTLRKRTSRLSPWYPTLTSAQSKALENFVLRASDDASSYMKTNLTSVEFDAFTQIPGVLETKIFCTPCNSVHGWARDWINKTSTRQLVCIKMKKKTTFRSFAPQVSKFCLENGINLKEPTTADVPTPLFQSANLGMSRRMSMPPLDSFLPHETFSDEDMSPAVPVEVIAEPSSGDKRQRVHRRSVLSPSSISMINDHLSSPEKVKRRRNPSTAISFNEDESTDATMESDPESVVSSTNKVSVLGNDQADKYSVVVASVVPVPEKILVNSTVSNEPKVYTVQANNAFGEQMLQLMGRMEMQMTNGFSKFDAMEVDLQATKAMQLKTNDIWTLAFDQMNKKIEELEMRLTQSQRPMIADSAQNDYLEQMMKQNATLLERIERIEGKVLNSAPQNQPSVTQINSRDPRLNQRVDARQATSDASPNWAEVTKRDAMRKQKSSFNERRPIEPIVNNNSYDALSELEVESDNDSVLSLNTIQQVKKQVPKFKVNETLSKLKQARLMVKPVNVLPPKSTGPLVSVYVNGLYKTDYSKIRQHMKTANVFMKNIKDLNWCCRSTLEIITYQTYETTLKQQLSIINWKPVENFDLTKPADKNANEDAKEYTLTQAARHFARSIYNRKHQEHDPEVLSFLVDYVKSKGQRFESAVDGFMKAIALDPSKFFPYLRNREQIENQDQEKPMSDESSTSSMEDEVQDLSFETMQLDSTEVEINQQ